MKRKVLERFNWERTVDATERLYRRVLNDMELRQQVCGLHHQPETHARTLECVFTTESNSLKNCELFVLTA